MTPGRSPSRDVDPWTKYLAALAGLRLTIERNIRDYNFEHRDGGRIVYLFDANVVQLFLNPAREGHHTAALGGLERNQDYLAANAVIASEFLFSRKLSGQQGAPPFITEAHAEDVSNMMARVAERLEQHRNPADMSHETSRSEELSVLLQQAEEGIGSTGAREALKKLASAFPGFASRILSGPVREAQQFKRMVDEDLVRPLRLLPEANTRVLAPDRRMVRVWERLLIAERISSHARVKSSARVTADSIQAERARRDAETLTQLLILNDKASEEGSLTRYVLVTTDRTMARTYAKWFLRSGSGNLNDYAIRHPSQYVPFLNTEQMGNSADGPELVQQIQGVLDSLFQPSHENDGAYLLDLLALADPEAFSSSADQDDTQDIVLPRSLTGVAIRPDSRALRKLVARWADANKGAVLLNAPFLRKHLDREWRDLANLLDRADDLQRNILDYLDDLMTGLENAHARFVVDGFLGHGDVESRSKSFVRYPLLLRSSLQAVEAGALAESFDEVDLAIGTLRSQGVSVAGEPFSTLDRGLFTVAACMAFRARQIPTALRFTGRAIALGKAASIKIGSNPATNEIISELHELYYLEAACSRFRVSDTDRFRLCRLHLNESLTFFESLGDWLGLVRTRCEQAGLMLAFCYSHAVQKVSALTSINAALQGHAPDVIRVFLEAFDNIVAAIGQIEFVSFHVPPHWSGLEQLLLTNTLDAIIYDMHVAHVEVFEKAFIEMILARTGELLISCNNLQVSPLSLRHAYVQWALLETQTARDKDRKALLIKLAEANHEASDPVDKFLAYHLEDWIQRDTFNLG